MKLFGKNKETVVISVKFDRFEKHVQRREMKDGGFVNTVINGTINCTIDSDGFGILKMFVNSSFGKFVERAIDRFCTRDENIVNKK